MKNTPHEESLVMSPTHNEKSPKGEALPSSDMLQPLKKVKPLRRVTCSQTLISTTIRSSLGREDSSASLSQMEHDTAKHQNGWPHICSQRSVEEKLQLATVGDGDKHLVEFSDALRTVTKALREVAESKARASNEAAAWKLKYEMERLRTFRLEQTHQEHCQSSPDFWSPGEVIELKEKEPDTGEPIFEACLFKCDSWSPSEPPEVDKENDNGEQSSIGSPTGRLSPQGNTDCCKNGGICTQQVLRSHSSSAANMTDLSDTVNRQEKAPFRLAWGCVGEKTGRHKHDVVSFESGNITTANRSSKQITLVWDSPPQSVFILSKPNSPTVETLCMEMVRWLREKGIGVYVEPTVKQELLKDDSYFSFVQTCETENEGICLHTKVDLVITLGGDGTVLWAAQMFKGPVPPVVSFSMGSLGFMTPFLAESDQYKECLQNIMKGPVYITLRHRLHCQIVRNPDNVKEGEEYSLPEDHLVLNEVSIDRGMSSFLTDLECYCDNLFVTSVQGDGLILSTPSGSTAYSLAAGGSMVHPQVPGILFTPICPHSLSFRPLILPEYVKVRVQVPINSRGQAWASFDGKDRQQLSGGDALICQLSAWPVPAACDKESTTEFLRSVREGLHWNLRKSQLSDGPHNSN